MNDNFKMVAAHEVRTGDVVNMLEGPKTVVRCQYMRNNTTIQFTFADGSKVKTDQFAPVYIQKTLTPAQLEERTQLEKRAYEQAIEKHPPVKTPPNFIEKDEEW